MGLGSQITKKAQAEEMKHIKILTLIKAIRESFPTAKEVYGTDCNPWSGKLKFHEILHAAFSSATLQLDNRMQRVTMIGERFYDISGEVRGPHPVIFNINEDGSWTEVNTVWKNVTN